MSLKETLHAIELTNILQCSPEDQQRILQIRNQPAVRRNMYTDHEISATEHGNWLAGLQRNNRVEFFVVRLSDDVVGGISLSQIDAINRRADWAFYISEQAQGKGLGSALEFKLLDYAFGKQALNKLNCEVLDFNAAVISLHKKFGFIEEGRRRAQVERDGAWHDAVLLGILASEWSANRDSIQRRLFSHG